MVNGCSYRGFEFFVDVFVFAALKVNLASTLINFRSRKKFSFAH